MNHPMPLEIDQLTIGYKRPVAKNISLALKSGEFVTIMGENGSGKTTLVETLMGYIRPHSGMVRFWGIENGKASRDWLNQKVGWVVSLQEDYPLGQTISAFFKSIRTAYPKWDEGLVRELSDRFKLDLGKKLSELSLGENSKVKLIKGLAFQPELLVLDELTANLSEDSKKALVAALLDRFSGGGMSVLYFSHSSEEAVRLSDRVLVLTGDGLKDFRG